MATNADNQERVVGTTHQAVASMRPGEMAAADSWTPGQQLALHDVRKQRRSGHRWLLVVDGECYILDDDGLQPSLTQQELMQGPLDVATARPKGEMLWMHNSVVQLKAYDLDEGMP